jgi:hypothetical protein
MRWRWTLLLLTVLIAITTFLDLTRTPTRDLRAFDPGEAGRLDAEMWRSYYDRDRLLLFRQLAELLRAQYHLSVTQSWVTAFHAARAAVRFQKGTRRAEYEAALPDLLAFYAAVLGPRRDPARAARLELEWWILHRERTAPPRQALEQALAALQAEIYQMPIERFSEHARLRAEAMLFRDNKAAQSALSEADWETIRDLLQQSWQSLHAALGSTCFPP